MCSPPLVHPMQGISESTCLNQFLHSEYLIMTPMIFRHPGSPSEHSPADSLHSSPYPLNLLSSPVPHPLACHPQLLFSICLHCHYLRPCPHNCFIGHYGIFTMFSPPSVSPSWLCNKQIRQVLGSNCLYLNPDLGPLFCNWKP